MYLGAAGEIHGVLRGPSVLRFSLSVGSVKPVNAVKYKGLPADVKCNEMVKFTVCLNTRKQPANCKLASVKCENLTDFELSKWDPNWEDDVHTNGKSIFDNIVDFFLNLNPVKWISALLDDITDVFGWLGFIGNVVIIAMVICLVCVARYLCPGCIRCCSQSCKKREAKEERRQNRREDYEFEIEMSNNRKKKEENMMSVGRPSRLPKDILQKFENRDLTSKI